MYRQCDLYTDVNSSLLFISVHQHDMESTRDLIKMTLVLVDTMSSARGYHRSRSHSRTSDHYESRFKQSNDQKQRHHNYKERASAYHQSRNKNQHWTNRRENHHNTTARSHSAGTHHSRRDSYYENSNVRQEGPTTTTRGSSSSVRTEYRVQHYVKTNTQLAIDECYKSSLKMSQDNSFVCATCKRKYSSAKMLRQHLEKHYTRYYCICSKATNSRSEMTKHLRTKCTDKIEFYHVDYCSFVQWRRSLNIPGASYERVYDEDLLPNGSPVILRKNSGYKSPLYIP